MILSAMGVAAALWLPGAQEAGSNGTTPGFVSAAPLGPLGTLRQLNEPTYQKLYVFQGGVDGSSSVASLLADGSGAFYGTVEIGGGHGDGQSCDLTGCGAVFKIVPGASVTQARESIVYGFYGSDYNDGKTPEAGLIRDRQGALYGTTILGGGGLGCEHQGCGTVFKLAPNGFGFKEHVLYVFQGDEDGDIPAAGLVAEGQGDLYGTTALGGGVGCFEKFGCGIAFKLTRTKAGYSESVIYRFQGGADGANPYAGLIVGKGGVLFGTTSAGGSGCRQGCGTVFSLSPSGSSYAERVLYAFKGGSDGGAPMAGLVIDPHGAMYGTTSGGGGTPCNSGAGCGTVFKLTRTPTGYHERLIYRFDATGTSDGAFPHSGVIIGNDGALYGTTTEGGFPGFGGYGTAYMLRPSPSGYVETIIDDFGLYANGAYPYGGLTFGPNGALYGTTERGGGGPGCPGVGGSGCGTVFEAFP